MLIIIAIMLIPEGLTFITCLTIMRLTAMLLRWKVGCKIITSEMCCYYFILVPCGWNQLIKEEDFPGCSVFKTPPFTTGGSAVKESTCIAGHLGSIPGSGRSPGEGNGNPLHYSYLENPIDRGAWWATVHGIAKNQTRLSMHVCYIIFIVHKEYTVKP